MTKICGAAAATGSAATAPLVVVKVQGTFVPIHFSNNTGAMCCCGGGLVRGNCTGAKGGGEAVS